MVEGKPNLITRLNYSETAKGLLALGIITPIALTVNFYDKGVVPSRFPTWMMYHMFDFFASPVNGASLRTVTSIAGLMTGNNADYVQFGGNKNLRISYPVFESIWATVPNFVTEAFQYGKQGFDPVGDGIAYTLGGFAWYAFDRSARKLYESGLTIPLYKALGIQDQRTDANS